MYKWDDPYTNKRLTQPSDARELLEQKPSSKIKR